LLRLVDVDLGCLQEWGQNFDDMPPLPSENNPGGVGEGGNQGAVTRTSDFGAVVILLGVSVREPGLQYMPYVPHFVPRGTASFGKPAWVDESSTSMSALKMSHPLSTQITGSMLLGELILILLLLPFF
jgi:hypothetical protein